MLRRKQLNSLNSGYVSIYRESKAPSSFGAKNNARTLADMDFIIKLACKQLSCREQDFEAAERLGYALECKLMVWARDCVSSDMKAVYDGKLYDIGSLDRDERFMYLYLSGGEQM